MLSVKYIRNNVVALKLLIVLKKIYAKIKAYFSNFRSELDIDIEKINSLTVMYISRLS